MKKNVFIPTDWIASSFFFAITLFIFIWTKEFISLTTSSPFIMGFLKLALLGTFGECLKYRLKNRKWIPPKIIVRFFVWGIFGLWLTSVFPFVDGGVIAIQGKELWPLLFTNFWLAFSKSLWINIFSGFAFSMMTFHYYIDLMLAKGKFLNPKEIFCEESKPWAAAVIPSLFLFWVPAHTFTFALPPEWRIICAAYLAIALGFIISIGSIKKL